MDPHANTSITSILDVDDRIAHEEPPAGLAACFSTYELFFWEQSPAHRRLLHLKSLFRAHPAVDAQFKKRRDVHLQTTQNPSIVHLRSYERAFVEVNRANAGCLGGGRVHRFLDLGCSPGGYSCWLLKANRGAQGLGLTLPDTEAKFAMSSEPFTIGGERYRTRYDNVITLAMNAVARGANPLVALDEDLRDDVVLGGAPADLYDLIIAGAFPTLEGRIPWWLRVQLLLSQVLIIMSNLAQGGTCVIVINTKPFLWIVDLVGMLRAAFATVGSCKSGKFHAKRSSCYIVCKGFLATTEDVQEYTGRLRTALEYLEGMARECRADGGETDTKLGVSGVVPQAPPTASGIEDLPLLSGRSQPEVFAAHSRFTLELFEPMWALQYNAIRDEFAGILSSQSVNGPEDGIGAPPINTRRRSTAYSPTTDLVLTPPPSPQTQTGKWRERGASISPSSPPGAYVSHPAFGFRPQPPAKGSPSQEPDLLTPPASPTVPKWRSQRRTTISEGRTDSDDWRGHRPAAGTAASPAAQPSSYHDVGGRPDLFGRRRASLSVAANSSLGGGSTWRHR